MILYSSSLDRKVIKYNGRQCNVAWKMLIIFLACRLKVLFNYPVRNCNYIDKRNFNSSMCGSVQNSIEN